MRIHREFSILTLALLLGCSSEKQAEKVLGNAPSALHVSGERPVGPRNDTALKERVRSAKERLFKSKGGQLVWRAIVAQGGLERWFSQGTMEFDFDYAPIDDKKRHLHTRSKVDLWSARVRQQRIDNPKVEFAFDGELAWIKPGPKSIPMPARFWATTPYYFVSVPWVMADPGTRFEVLEDEELSEKTYKVVKVSYAAGVGDSPKDYYILYINSETHLVDALRYVVTYPGFYAKGKRSKEKLMIYSERRKSRGLAVAHRYDTYAWDEKAKRRGKKVTNVSAGAFVFGRTYPSTFFDPPAGAVATLKVEEQPSK